MRWPSSQLRRCVVLSALHYVHCAACVAIRALHCMRFVALHTLRCVRCVACVIWKRDLIHIRFYLMSVSATHIGCHNSGLHCTWCVFNRGINAAEKVNFFVFLM